MYGQAYAFAPLAGAISKDRGPDRPLVQLCSTFVAMGAALLPVAEPASVACLPWYLIAPRRVEPAVYAPDLLVGCVVTVC